MMATHVAARADVTIAAMPVDRADGPQHGHHAGRRRRAAWSAFWKSRRPTRRWTSCGRTPPGSTPAASPAAAATAWPAWASTCSIATRWSTLLTKTDYHDFGNEIFPAADPHAPRAGPPVRRLLGRHRHDPLVLRSQPGAGRSRTRRSTWPRPRRRSTREPAFCRRRDSTAPRSRNSLIADGCAIESGTVIENSVIGLRCRIGQGVTIRNSILMGSDEYETPDEARAATPTGRPLVGIGAGTVIEGAIIDKNCRIGQRVRIANDSRRRQQPGNPRSHDPRRHRLRPKRRPPARRLADVGAHGCACVVHSSGPDNSLRLPGNYRTLTRRASEGPSSSVPRLRVGLVWGTTASGVFRARIPGQLQLVVWVPQGQEDAASCVNLPQTPLVAAQYRQRVVGATPGHPVMPRSPNPPAPSSTVRE